MSAGKSTCVIKKEPNHKYYGAGGDGGNEPASANEISCHLASSYTQAGLQVKRTARAQGVMGCTLW